jgi:hypothetical protein
MELVVSAAAPSEHNENADHVGEKLPWARQIAEVAHETSAANCILEDLAVPLASAGSH